ncbi:MAG TPA: DNA polymerase III subunit alpha, partial [Rhodospirillaceae bacterium]|nr:DNA polymerase III subunit alpha [Rhodospirillaceae bacterium]
LAALKNVGAAAMEALVAERRRGGVFKDLGDFARRMDARAINKRQMENLVRSGAFDSLNSNRAQLFEGIEAILAEASSAASERDSGQASLFGGGGRAETALVMASRVDWSPSDRLLNELEAIGFYLSAHPMDGYAKSLKRLGVLKLVEVPAHLAAGGKSRVKLAGMLNRKQERTSSRGSRYAFLTLSDASAQFEVMIFSELLAQAKDLLEPNSALLVTVEARLDDDQLKLTGHQIESLDQAAAKASAGLKIFVRDEAPLMALKQLMAKEPRGRGRIAVVAQTDQREVEAWLNSGFALSASLIGAVRTIPGVVEVQEI